MRRLTTPAAVLAASTAISGCASLGPSASLGEAAHSISWNDVRDRRGAVIVAEQPAPAPAGLAGFCARLATVCGDGADEQGRAAGAADERAFQRVAWSADAPDLERGGWSAEQRDDPEAIFARLLELRARGVRVRHARSEVRLDERLWNELALVNRLINRSIEGRSDASRYGVNEYWAMPITESARTGASAQGDCEDYALEKRAQLIALGWDSAALALAVANAPDIGMHAVLVVQTDRGDFVLDNLHDEPRAPDALNYQWVSRQAGRNLTVWASARLGEAPAPEAPREMLMASLAPASPGDQLAPALQGGPILKAPS